jgi:protein-L-isoaspartate(D-aspartate) O-methyltransferase
MAADGPANPDKDQDPMALNQALVDDLKNRELIQTPRAEAAFRTVLRHLFLPGVPLEEVYSDRAISAKQDEEGKWISSSSQPAIMAIMLEQLSLEPGHKVLEVGTGPGYNAALMAHIVGETGQVVTVEIDQDLADAAREHLAAAGIKQVQVLCSDGGYGVPEQAPFDRIILTVGAPDITPAWWHQMKPDGRLVLPLQMRGAMKSIAFEQIEDHLRNLSVADCGFISLRGDFASASPNRIQLGPDPGLYVEPLDDFPIDPNAAYQLLTGNHKDWDTKVNVVVWDVIGGSLWTWLALHEPRMCKLIAEGEAAEQNLVPPLLGFVTKQKTSQTAMLPGETGVTALMRPPDQLLPMIPFEKLFAPDSPVAQPFPLFLRQFGEDESTVHQLLTQIQAWKTAGSPPSNSMHIRAYPKDADYRPSRQEIVLEKEWTKLVIEWPGTVKPSE